MLHWETVAAPTRELLYKLMADPGLKDFHLVGGTALALQLGHRISVDIDLFTRKEFDSGPLLRQLEKTYEISQEKHTKNNIWCFIDGVKVDLITHDYPVIDPLLTMDRIRMARLEEIGAMKLHAVVQNGERLKDFVDIYYLLEQRPLSRLITVYESKYPQTNSAIAKSGLAYHDDIDFNNPEISLLKNDPGWPNMAERLKESVVHPFRLFNPFTPKLRKGLRP